jgi:hypothetical protein
MGFFFQRKTPTIDPVAVIHAFGEQLSAGVDPIDFFAHLLARTIVPDVLKSHGLDFTALPEFYHQLLLYGAGQKVRGDFVPVMALANPVMLDFIVTILHRNDGWDAHNKWIYIAAKLVESVETRSCRGLESTLFSDLVE